MAKYNVHFIGYYGYDFEVDAKSEEEAKEIAKRKFENLSDKDFSDGAWFELDGVDVWEEE